MPRDVPPSDTERARELSEEPSGSRWEYRFVDTDSDSWDALEKAFQEMGDHGWEFAGRVERIVTDGSSEDSLFIPALPHVQHRYLFKRLHEDGGPSPARPGNQGKR